MNYLNRNFSHTDYFSKVFKKAAPFIEFFELTEF